MNKLHLTVSAMTITLVLAFGAHAQKLAPRYTDPAIGVSIQPPKGWTADTSSDGTAVITAPAVDGFKANMNIKTEVNSLKLAEYVTTGVDHILANYKQLGTESTTLAGRTKFNSTSGVTGIRIIMVSIYKGYVVRSTQYYFQGKAGRKYVVTFTSMDKDKKTNDPLFDRSARTFALEDKRPARGGSRS